MKCSHCKAYIQRIQALETLLTLSDDETMQLKSRFDTLRVSRDIAEESNFNAIRDRVHLEKEIDRLQQIINELNQHGKNE